MFNCQKCEENFTSKSLLNKHLENNCINNDKNLSIKMFTKINNLKSKINRFDIIYDQNKCGYCKKIYSNKSNLKVHIKNSCKVRISIINEIEELNIKLNTITKNEQENL
jgi:hypothetical protein